MCQDNAEQLILKKKKDNAEQEKLRILVIL